LIGVRFSKPVCGALLAVVTATAGVSVAMAQPAPPAAAQQVHPARRIPASADFPTGPAIGERLPDFTLRNQRGEAIDFHADRGGHKAAVLFQRSAVW